MRLKKLVIGILVGLLLAALGLSVFSFYQMADASQWDNFVKIFGSLGFGIVVLVVLIMATVIYNYWRRK
jgi:hypothetical protein